MHLRLVRVKVKPEALGALVALYQGRIIPALERVPGCRYAGFMQSVQHADECLSLTLWESQAEAAAYERGGLFAALLEESKPHLLESSESQVRLSENLTLEYVPVPEEPEIEAMPVSVRSTPQTGRENPGGARWLRTVVLKVRPGKMVEFKREYAERVVPALRAVKGCRFIYLTENPKKPDELVSITSWQSEEDAKRYEQSGQFQTLLESQQHLLSELYQWKHEQEKVRAGSAATSDDVVVEHYNVLAGKDFA